MLKIINLAENNKFIDFAINQFNQLDNIDVSFYILQKSFNPNFIRNKNIIYFTDEKKLIETINKENPDYVILHSFYFMHLKQLCKIKSKIIACSWGYDIYSDSNNKYTQLTKILNTKLYKDETVKLLNDTPIIYKLSCLFRKVKHFFTREQYWYNKLVNKFEYFSTILPYEFDLIKQKLPSIKRFEFKYINPVDNQIKFRENKNKEPIIIIGNSDDPSNNHADILKLLEERKIKCKAYIPFSYPYDVKYYKENLKNYAKTLKYTDCIFLDNYISRENYFELLNSCSCAIYGFTEQQAIGNIYQMFRTGKKVFFFKYSKMYNYFSKQKLNIFNINDNLNSNIFNNYLPIKEQKNNFNYVINDENYKTYIEYLNNFLINLINK